MQTASSAKRTDRKSTRLNSSHANIYTLSLHDALPICLRAGYFRCGNNTGNIQITLGAERWADANRLVSKTHRSEEHTSELQSRQYLHAFPTRRSSDLPPRRLFPLRK